MKPAHHVSPATWQRTIKQANDGDPRHLLELLLVPTETDGHNVPQQFIALPDDALLRYDLLRVLMLGPWKSATTITELMTKTGWGKGKPALSEIEVGFADIAVHAGVDIDDLADAYNVEAETLRKKLKARKKRA